MKELVCDMCGSNNVIKQDGLFVCQACKTKYSIEEAKKMMFGDVVEVEGTVKIDSSDELANLYELARRARETSDTTYALGYYEQILIKDPNSWEAQFCVGLYRLYNYDKINADILDDFKIPLQSSVIVIKDKLTNDEEKTQALAFITNELIDISSEIFDINYEFLRKIRSSNNNIVAKPHAMLISASDLLFDYGDSIIDINDKSRNFAIECWKTAIEWGATFNYVFDRSTRKEHKNLIETYVQKIQQYNPQYEAPKFKTSITRVLW